MDSCVETLQDFRVGEEFPRFFLLRSLDLFSTSQNLRRVVSEFIEEETRRRIERARTQSVTDSDEAAESIRSRIIRCMASYISLIAKITQFICHKAAEESGQSALRIVQVRTSFDFRTWLIRILFIIDADPITELHFSHLLNGVEKYTLLEECFVPALLHLNIRNGETDGYSIERDYPLVICLDKSCLSDYSTT